MPTLTQEAKSNSLMSMLLKQVYDTVTNGGNPDSLGPNDFIAFDPVGITLSEDTFDYALNGLFGDAPSPKPMLDGKGKPILDANGNPKIDMEAYQNALSNSKFRKYLQMEQFAAMVDVIPSQLPPLTKNGNGRELTIMSIMNDSQKRVSKVYEDLLQWSVVVDTQFDTKVEKKLNSLRDKLFKIKKVKNPDFDENAPIDDMNKPELFHTFVAPTYAKYIEYQMKYYDIVDANNEIRTAADNGDAEAMAKLSIDGKNMKKREDAALKAWQSLGYKEAVENIQNYLSEVEQKNMLVIKKRMESEFRNSQRTRVLDYTNYSPSIPVAANALKESKGWPTVTIVEGESNYDYSKSVHNWGAAGGFSLGIFSIGAKAGGKHEKTKINTDYTNMKISFKLGKVRVERGWFSQQFIESKYWKLHEQSPQALNGDIISDGKGKGLMPSIITELIIAKDVSLDFANNSTAFTDVKNSVNSGAAVGIGPFVFGGSYSYDNQDVQSNAKWNGKKLTSDGIYIIGYKCHVVPKSPNPNPEIKKWTDGKS
ncbi:hypothetical protein D1631_14670 [Chryseobacterium nematophagum]|uniref:Uncharacterized protein n=2 Tax=Chryseobacterium TaxID=59732 RepID=A0A3M7LBI2_9FLAO|nr:MULTISPECIES: hypothetical protein [Chryseobacterium]RMZ58816.1 hypothetical protein D1632_14645 [Chryseobacterium nematophagum]RNA63085.1 hypothetical protein D1631_14670 [Chryseobacterium nematophagum]CAA7194672.1 hypothetical protein CHRY9293_00960 [Chryseobacterium potabilaquae]